MEKIGYFLIVAGLVNLVVGVVIFVSAYNMDTSVSLDAVPIGRLESALQVLREQKRALERKDPKPRIINIDLMEKKKDRMALGYVDMCIGGLMVLTGVVICSANTRT